jgi:hypothetical protein
MEKLTTKYIKHDFQVTSLKGLFLNLHPSEIKTTTSRTRQDFLRFFFSFFWNIVRVSSNHHRKFLATLT